MLAAIAAAWTTVCLGYVVANPAVTFGTYLGKSELVTAVVAVAGAVLYLGALWTFQPADRAWRRSGSLLAGVVLMAAAFARAASQPPVALAIQAPLGVLFVASVWRFRAEPLVYLAILGIAVAVTVAARDHLAPRLAIPMTTCLVSAASAVSLAMVLVAAGLGLARHDALNLRWYRQGFLIVPLVVSSLAVIGTAYSAVWYGADRYTVWNLAVWWAVLLVSAIGLKQPDLFGFSSIGAGLAAAAAFAVLGGEEVEGYWGRYSAVLLVTAFSAAVLASLLTHVRHRQATAGFPRALYLATAALAIGGLLLEPLETGPKYLGVDFLIAAGVLVLAHSYRAPAWVNYFVAALITAGVVSLARLGPDATLPVWHHRFIQTAAALAVGWLVVALLLREVLRHTASDRTARQQATPFTVFGLATTLVLAGYLAAQQVRAYAELMEGSESATLVLLGPLWGLGGWLAVLLAFLLSMWLVRHTLRTCLFYVAGILATCYLGLFHPSGNLYGFLVYAIAGYGAAHLMVYLYEAKSMAVLSRICGLYRDEHRASTAIFTLAVASCFAAAVLAAFRLNATESLIMLGVMSAVFLAWSFVWLRAEMVYPAVLMVTLWMLSAWHNKAGPMEWHAHRLGVNAAVFAFSAIFWLGVGNRLQAIRGEVFQLGGPARACSAVLAIVGLGFAAALAFSPTFQGEAWQTGRTLGEWATGLSALGVLIVYFAWCRILFGRRFDDVMGAVALLLLGLYVGIYLGIQLRGGA